VTREVLPTGAFRRDYKRLAKSPRYDMADLKTIVAALAEDQLLDPTCRDHALTGNWRDHRECHIKPDWLLVYRLEAGRLILVRTGTHSDLFK